APLTFFAALTLLLSLKAYERVTRRAFAAAGAAAGLAAACHYAGATVVALPIAAASMTPNDDSSRWSRGGIAIAAAALAFIVAVPLSVRDLPAFLDGVAAAAAPPSNGVAGVANVDPTRALLDGLQWPGLILALAGFSLALVRAFTGPGHTRWVLLASFPLLYFVLLGWHRATSQTAVLPILPPLPP